MERSGKRIRALRERYRHQDDAPTAVLLGCEYVLKLDRETDDALVALSRLFGSLRLLSGCCGLPLETAGDPERADGLRDMLLAQARSAKRLIAVDAGCAFRLRGHAEPFAQAVLPRLELQRLEAAPVRKLRYHDPCLLGRRIGRLRRAATHRRSRLGGRPGRVFAPPGARPVLGRRRARAVDAAGNVAGYRPAPRRGARAPGGRHHRHGLWRLAQEPACGRGRRRRSRQRGTLAARALAVLAREDRDRLGRPKPNENPARPAPADPRSSTVARHVNLPSEDATAHVADQTRHEF